MEKLKIALQVMVPPYTYEDLDSALNIAEACLDRGHDAYLFLFSDSILAANAAVRPVRSDRNIPKRIETLIAEKGLHVDICGICMDYRGVTRDQVVPGSEPSGLPELADLIYTSDRFINFMA
jgi:tRNA 2-thiouridine synthesizing protein D